MNKKKELSFCIHLLLLAIIFIFAFKVYDIDIFKVFEKNIDEFSVMMKNEVNTYVSDMYNSGLAVNDYGNLNLELEEYRNKNITLVDEAIYTIKYFMPAILVIILLVIVNIEDYIISHIVYAYNNSTYDKEKDTDKTKIKKLIRQRLEFKYRKVSMSRKIPKFYLLFLIIMYIFNLSDTVLGRTIENMMLVGAAVITYYGLRIVIDFFKVKNNIIKTLIILLNVCMGVLYPQIYFIIGLIESLIPVRIVIRKKME